MNKLILRKRFIKYLIHLGLSFLVPFSLIAISIAISGSREQGMVFGLAVAFLTLNIFFAFYFLRASILINILCGLIVTIISIGLTWLVGVADIKLSFDFYGVYTLLFCYGVFSILSWEGTYQLLKRVQTVD